MQVDWNTLTMTLNISGTKVLLQGETSLSKTLVLLISMWKAFQEQREGMLLELGNIVVETNCSPSQSPTMIVEILEEFSVVFEELTQLPPRMESRSCNCYEVRGYSNQCETIPISLLPEE